MSFGRLRDRARGFRSRNPTGMSFCINFLRIADYFIHRFRPLCQYIRVMSRGEVNIAARYHVGQAAVELPVRSLEL